MAPGALSRISIVMSLLAFGLVTGLYIWPELQTVATSSALEALVVIHAFRFVGLAFLVTGVTSPNLPPAFSRPAAFGDLTAAVLAIFVVLALSAHASWALLAVWIFNIWGTADLLYAMYQGNRSLAAVGPGALGAAFFIPTLIVPPLLVTHGLIFWLLLHPGG